MKLLRAFFALLALMALPVGANAQYARQDSLGAFKATQLIAPAVLLGGGLGIHYLGHDSVDAAVREWNLSKVNVGGTGPFYDIGTWVEYGTPVVYMGAGLLGAKSRHSFADRAMEGAMSYLFCVSTGYILKKAFHTLRPDGSNYNSFPSGHSMITFTGAELMRMDYGPWWGAAFYGLACGTAVERVYADRHWLSDVLAGAGIGILSAHVGAWLLEPVKSLFGIPDWSWDGLSTRPVQIAFMPSADPLSGAPTANLSICF
ncbi:MAG: phosphatase PAP2 family protein [Bacteroidales bacterium]|nr:phosphatase PAP2 family protein [Bacteroidales bacterium]